MTKRGAPTIGDILVSKLSSVSLDPRVVLMAEQDNRAAEIAKALVADFVATGLELGLDVVNFGIKKPSRTGMIRVVVSDKPGTNLSPRSPAFKRFVRLVWPYNLWLAWVAVSNPPPRKGRRRHHQHKEDQCRKTDR